MNGCCTLQHHVYTCFRSLLAAYQLPQHTIVYCSLWFRLQYAAILRPTANSELLSSNTAHAANVLIPPRLRKFADVRSCAQRVLRADSFLCSLSTCWEKLIRFTWVLRLLVLLTVCLSHGTVDSATKAIWQSSAHSHVYSPFKAWALLCLTE